ncbi:metallophosphoesterase family protein [Ktedonobacter racemifer]|uniref:Metallophosphoesterase n=1 Tax=Ktedonobacter racemifer DSM 44963 TaxID=485913 RepID=D6TE70_KTERA|nr:metallophosphoesterase family protein [Ktedonobacter racemifer]EFH88443.1 metallophosphoesterase [Ktedonobacter racemifer DSM 44963]
MSETKTFQTSLAVIADIHGNRWALEAVLQDIDRRGIQQIVNLGDHLTGPLDPAGTADLLIARKMVNVCGNDDRELFLPQEKRSLSQNYTCTQLTPAHFAWLRSLPDTTVIADELFVCHGDLFDAPYLLEEVTHSGVFLRNTLVIATSVAEITQPVILSGHSHIPRTVSLSQGKLLINPGSVGMPAYSMETYVMESGSPHARYALLHQKQHGWQVEHIQVPYAWEQAAQIARGNQRADWAQWLTTGRAR